MRKASINKVMKLRAIVFRGFNLIVQNVEGRVSMAPSSEVRINAVYQVFHKIANFEHLSLPKGIRS